MVVIILVLFISGCSPTKNTDDIKTKYPDVPTYGIVLEIQQEEEKWKQKK